MNDLENRARPFLEPMIRGYSQTIFPEGAGVVAYWALKTAMMIDFAQEPEHRSVPESDYPALFAAKGLPPNTFIWVGACDFGAGALARSRTLNLNAGDAHPAGFGVTVGVGHLVIEIIRVPVEDGQTVKIGGQLALALRRLWPYTNVVVWPSPVVLSRDDASSLGDLVEVSPVHLF